MDSATVADTDMTALYAGSDAAALIDAAPAGAAQTSAEAVDALRARFEKAQANLRLALFAKKEHVEVRGRGEWGIAAAARPPPFPHARVRARARAPSRHTFGLQSFLASLNETMASFDLRFKMTDESIAKVAQMKRIIGDSNEV